MNLTFFSIQFNRLFI